VAVPTNAQYDDLYFVTDIECSGFAPGRHSMLSFATVAVSATGVENGRFEAVLAELPGASWDPGTREWFESEQPAALVAATADPREPAAVMQEYAAWVLGFEATRIFAASPLAFDGVWIDHYLRRFTPYGLAMGPYATDAPFQHALCLRSYAAAVTGRPVTEISPQTLPPEWFGQVEHTHRAIDDALGYANLLAALLRRSA
jgi:hypothetical protein